MAYNILTGKDDNLDPELDSNGIPIAPVPAPILAQPALSTPEDYRAMMYQNLMNNIKADEAATADINNTERSDWGRTAGTLSNIFNGFAGKAPTDFDKQFSEAQAAKKAQITADQKLLSDKYNMYKDLKGIDTQAEASAIAKKQLDLSGKRFGLEEKEFGIKEKEAGQKQTEYTENNDPSSRMSILKVMAAKNFALKSGMPKEEVDTTFKLGMSGADVDKVLPIFEKSATAQLAREAKVEETKFTPAEKAIDSTAGKAIAEWNISGKPAFDKNITALYSALGEIEKSKGDTIPASGPFAQYANKILMRTEPKVIEQNVQQAVNAVLRATLGAQFTEQEGIRVAKQAYDPSLTPDQNIVKVKGIIKQLEDNAASMDAQSKYIRENKGTLKGYGATPAPKATPTPVKQVQYKGKTYNVDANGDMTEV